MKVNDIRPDNLLAGQRAAMKKDIALLASWSKGFVDVSCPACNAAIRSPLYEKYGMQHQQCDDCGTQFISPRPTPEMLTRFYAESENYAYWAKYIYPASAEARRKNIFGPRAEQVRAICAEKSIHNGVFVEVGAGYGIFCEELARSGMFSRIIGLEPSPGLAQICRDRGIEIIERPFEETDLDVPADIIAAFEVIEHLFGPAEFAGWLHRALRPGGYAILTCPNIAGFDTMLLGRNAVAVDHQHLNYFTPDSLSHLMRRAGFVDIEVSTPGQLDVDLVRRAYRDGQVTREQIGPFVAAVIESESEKTRAELQAFLRSARLSSNMMVVARRPEESL